MASSGKHGNKKAHKRLAQSGSNLAAIQEVNEAVAEDSDSDNPWYGLPNDPVIDADMDRKVRVRRQWADIAVRIADRLESDALEEVHDRLKCPVASGDDLAKQGLEVSGHYATSYVLMWPS